MLHERLARELDVWTGENSGIIASLRQAIESTEFKDLVASHGVTLTSLLIEQAVQAWISASQRWEKKACDLNLEPTVTNNWLYLTELGVVVADFDSDEGWVARPRAIVDFLNVVYALDVVDNCSDVIDAVRFPGGSGFRTLENTIPSFYLSVSIRDGRLMGGARTLGPVIEVAPGFDRPQALLRAVNQFASNYYLDHHLKFSRGDSPAF